MKMLKGLRVLGVVIAVAAAVGAPAASARTAARICGTVMIASPDGYTYEKPIYCK
jgi:hypothetical protein